MTRLGPFFAYYGGKWRSATRYPAPACGRIVEPFAGAAGYSLRVSDGRPVTLVERDPVIAGVWRYLLRVSAAEILALPLVDSLDDLPASTPQEARDLVGLNLGNAITGPRRSLSSGLAMLRERGRKFAGWSESKRERVAVQVSGLRNWEIIEGDYSEAPDIEATWFIDPPYREQGHHYRHGPDGIDFVALAEWCRGRRGQVIVCEAVGADWLPFRPAYSAKAGPRSSGPAREAVWP